MPHARDRGGGVSRPFNAEYCERVLAALEDYARSEDVRRLQRAWTKELKWAKRVARKRAMAATPAGAEHEPEDKA